MEKDYKKDFPLLREHRDIIYFDNAPHHKSRTA